MPVNSANQGIPEQQGADAANLPNAQVVWDAVIENRLVQRYVNEADRTARNPTPNENEISTLAGEDRVEIWNTSYWTSIYNRIFFQQYRVTSFNTATSSTTLQNVTSATIALPTSGTFGFSGVIFVSGTTTADVKFALTWPAGATATWGLHTSDATALTNFQGAATTTSGQAIAMSLNGTSSPQMATIEGEITMGGTAGNLQLQAAQNTSDATAVLIRLARMFLWRTP